jgi:hypothetical protein
MSQAVGEMVQTMDEKDVETTSTHLSTDDGGDAGFEPIRPPASQNASRRTSVSLSQSRSNNGYGIDGGAGIEGVGDLQTTRLDKDPFEVGWDNGDSDPLCPRSMSKARKWLIVSIVSAASVCV